ncbi:CpsD/CapB family tyrosine-protein kinase [Bacillus timonensis]|nr:CpsD/CapB family tyrosine-protein kinase [Bacillus timonensis]
MLKKMLNKLKGSSYSTEITEPYKKIQINIQQMKENVGKSMLVTSPQFQDGKANVTANLAAAFAKQGNRVLLVDADIRNPTLHELFQISNRFGVTDFLKEEQQSEFFIYKTPLTDLYVLPTGKVPKNPSNVFYSKKVENMLKRFERAFDVIIIESPPFLPTADAQIIAEKCDDLILVIKEDETKSEDLKLTIKQLQSSKRNVLGIIYQKTNHKKMLQFFNRERF